MIFLAIILCAILFFISRGGSAAFGRGVGTLMAISFLGFLLFFGGGAILLFLLPLLLTFFLPVLLFVSFLMLVKKILPKSTKSH